eukprot:360867_1
MAQANDDPPALVLEDNPAPNSGWEMHVDFQSWTTEDVLNWITLLDDNDDFFEIYDDAFQMHNITGSDFTRRKLGNEEWCRDNLNMTTSNHAKQFSDIVRHRITTNENLNRQPKKQNKDDEEAKPPTDDPEPEKAKLQRQITFFVVFENTKKRVVLKNNVRTDVYEYTMHSLKEKVATKFAKYGLTGQFAMAIEDGNVIETDEHILKYLADYKG